MNQTKKKQKDNTTNAEHKEQFKNKIKNNSGPPWFPVLQTHSTLLLYNVEILSSGPLQKLKQKKQSNKQTHSTVF